MIEAPPETTKRARDLAYQKAYRDAPEHKVKQKAYRSTSDYKAYQKAYWSTPEHKAYQKAYRKVYRTTPEYKAYQKEYQKAYQASSASKAAYKKYHESPEVKARLKAAQKAYLATPEGRAKREAYITRRWKTDVNYRIRKILRARLYSAIKNNVKCGSAVRDLGCSIEDFKIYIESKFQPGMTWENHSMTGWHLDHIRPLASFDLQNPNDFRCAFHFSNYQPLWASDNLLKGAKLDNPIVTP